MEKPTKRSTAPNRMVELLIETASGVAKPQHPIASGIIRPPPPIPPMLARPRRRGRMTIPTISLGRNG